MRPAKAGHAGGFDADFVRLVRPRLVKAVTAHAGLVADGVETFSEAEGAVMALACGYGAGFLSEGHFCDLEEWVLSDLGDACEAWLR